MSGFDHHSESTVGVPRSHFAAGGSSSTVRIRRTAECAAAVSRPAVHFRKCYILCVMERVGVRELRQNLSVYLRRVRRGESLEVTERGQPVAVLQPIPSTLDPLAALAARGIAVRRGRGNLADLAAPVPLDAGRSASGALQELREDRL